LFRERAVVFGHESFSNSEVLEERTHAANLVEPHEPRVPGYVGGDYRRQPASDPSWLLLLHGQAAQAAPSVPGCRLPPVWAWGRATSTNGTIGFPRLR